MCLVYNTYTLPPWGGVSRKMYLMKNDSALIRLKNVEGHIRGIERMIEDGSYCIDVIRQVQAVQAALNKVNAMILEEHLNSCLITAVRGEDPDERERVLKEIADVFDMASKT
jgi:CsoR family transcriptional regulator, copper-sensing transcriptional repressor